MPASAASNGHLLDRLFRATGDNSLFSAARTHFGQALRIRGSGDKLAGYSFGTAINGTSKLR